MNNQPLQPEYNPDEEIRLRWQAAHQILSDRFGHARLLPTQQKVIDAVFRGENVLAVLPTGAR